MQILHLNWINKEKSKNFFLWGEASRETAAKKRAATTKHTLHPFCSTKKELGNIFEIITKDIKSGDRCDKLALSLPSFSEKDIILDFLNTVVDEMVRESVSHNTNGIGAWVYMDDIGYLSDISDIFRTFIGQTRHKRAKCAKNVLYGSD